jgi:hypothetical protein
MKDGIRERLERELETVADFPSIDLDNACTEALEPEHGPEKNRAILRLAAICLRWLEDESDAGEFA